MGGASAYSFEPASISGSNGTASKKQMANTALIGIGSNWEPEINVEKAREMLTARFPGVRFSEAVYTEPVGCRNPALFLNQTALVHIDIPQAAFTEILKRIEREIGRTPEDKAREKIKIDLDLLQWNASVLKPGDLKRPDITRAIRYLQQQ